MAITLWPAGELRGKLQLGEGQRRPPNVQLRFRHPPAPPRAAAAQGPAPDGEVTCRVLVSAHFRCALPAGQWNLRVGIAGFAPQYLWDLTLARASLTDLPPTPLQPGGSVAGWLPTCEGLAQRTGCEVTLTPLASTQVRDARTAAMLHDLAHTTAPAENGFFQLAGVPAGSYQLVAAQKGFASGRLAPVLVVENRETELREPLVLQPPLTLQVNLTPATDPTDQPWAVKLYAEGQMPGNRSEVSQPAAPGADGIWQWADLAPGSYVVSIADGSGQEWDHVDVALEPGQEVVDVSLPFVHVRGRVRIGDRGIPARLHWPVSIFMEADEHGDFAGILPRQGEYPMVMLRSQDPPLKRAIPHVKVEVAEGETEAWVDLVLPDTEISGQVVDEAGSPVPEAIVSPVSDGQTSGAVRVDKAGRFRLVGLPEGEVSLQAQTAEAVSAVVTVRMLEKLPPPPVRLVLKPHREFRGRVVAPNGSGVPGARVLAYSPGMLTMEPAVTDGAGMVSLQLSGAASQAYVIVQAAGYLLSSTTVPVGAEEPVTIPVESQGGGTLVVETALNQLDPAAPVAFFVLHRNVAIPLPELGHWQGLHGVAASPESSQLTIPQVEPGDWAVCLPALSALDPGAASFEVPETACISGYLAPGGELLLDATPLLQQVPAAPP